MAFGAFIMQWYDGNCFVPIFGIFLLLLDGRREPKLLFCTRKYSIYSTMIR